MFGDLFSEDIAAPYVMGCVAVFVWTAIKGHMASDWFFTLLRIRQPDVGAPFGKDPKPAWTFTAAGIEYELLRHARFSFLIKRQYRSLGCPELVSAGESAFRWYAISVLSLIVLFAPALLDLVARSLSLT
ncbi:hypothetical protein [Silanimonas sp.]|jgi:hypothetical protein|uniref:hypothetical protein n=1 Tax=Silanimonas sp. TaxID=1929290 RepID=UPI0022C7DD28|nr:hypothetical protein [Silanimonas sp.]MCZ8115961.1 hypothetical protein [Silanimonas sp.]